ncbi:hypothetical protein [Halobacillus hunanensis]|uniref:hypothetical protein n=1 Tax=Halobacillus hunanensis TaxID=578214 RepID=UPI0009A810AE|nr:hypothetical protein [Halobacillus hunanensis]
MKFLMDLMSVITFSPPITDVTEEDICENIRHLKKNEWFQRDLSHADFRKLIVSNKDVRFAIGKLNTKRLKRNPYKYKYQRKIQKVMCKA